MQKYLSDSSAGYPAGISPGRKVFKIKAGPYAGRIVVLFAKTTSEIRLTYADYPYIAWSIPQLIVSDAADQPFEACLADDNSLALVYTRSGNMDLVFVHLAYIVGVWSPGSSVLVNDSDDNFYPSLVNEPDGTLWCAWSRYSSGLYHVTVKYSDDFGANWSAGVTLSAGASSASPRLAVMGNHIYAAYSTGGDRIACRRKHFEISSWEDEQDIDSGGSYDSNFDLSSAGNFRLGLAFVSGAIHYREFDGQSWSGLYTVDADGGISPQIRYYNNVPFVFYLKSYGAGQNIAMVSRLHEGIFTTPLAVERSQRLFDKVLCYNAASGTIEDKTSAAGNITGGDIYHSQSSALLEQSGDCLYLGLSERFFFVRFILATEGSGGAVNWKYFNGENWANFEPSGGGWAFETSSKGQFLWADSAAIPGDWQKVTVEGNELFWIKATVGTPFSTRPVGSQITAAPNLTALAIGEG